MGKEPSEPGESKTRVVAVRRGSIGGALARGRKRLLHCTRPPGNAGACVTYQTCASSQPTCLPLSLDHHQNSPPAIRLSQSPTPRRDPRLLKSTVYGPFRLSSEFISKHNPESIDCSRRAGAEGGVNVGASAIAVRRSRADRHDNLLPSTTRQPHPDRRPNLSVFRLFASDSEHGPTK